MLLVRIQLSNGQIVTLDESIEIKDKIDAVTDLVDEWMPILIVNWNSNAVKYFLDSLSNYIVWHKEEKEKGKEDKEVLSRKKMEKMVRFKKTSKQVNFSDMPKNEKEKFFGVSNNA